MPAFDNLPWLRGGDFLRAIMAGSDDALSRERLRLASQRDERPRFFGGGSGGFVPRLPRVIPEAAEPTGPYLGGIPGSPVLVDPERTGKPEAPRLPFTFGGKQFITNQNGNVVDYSHPPNLSTPFGSATEGRFQLDPKTGKPVQILPPAPRATNEPRLSTVDTSSMTDNEKEIAAMFNPSRVSGPASVVQNYLKGGNQLAAPVQANGTRVRSKSTGKMGTVVNGEVVWDEDSDGTSVAEFNPLAGLEQPGVRGFMYTGPNYESNPAR